MNNSEAVAEVLLDKDPRCDDCFYGFDIPEKPNKYEGECYLNPPVVVVIDEDYVSTRPKIHSDDFCAHFRRRDKTV